jgi:putative nucleotidyltransferase with HDIG domain
MRLDSYLSKYTELKALYDLAEHDYKTKGLVHHNWNHILRDLARGVVIGESEGANMKIVLAGILLHDIGRLHSEQSKDHYVAGMKMAPKYLKSAGLTKDGTDQIVRCIKAHGPRGLEEPKTLEAKVCYDVDVLSHSCGTVGVARVFHFFIAEANFTVKQMMKIGSGKRGPRKSFYTETGRKLGQKGYLKAKKFWKELGKELEEEEQGIKKTIPEYEGD